MEYDHYFLPVEYLNRLIAEGINLSAVGVRHSFKRNFVLDKTINDGSQFQLDERWILSGNSHSQQTKSLTFKGINDEDEEWYRNK